MAGVVQARLDDETELELARLREQLGSSSSEVVREAIRVLASITPGGKKRPIAGAGKYRSGIPDLASNKKHLKDYGR